MSGDFKIDYNTKALVEVFKELPRDIQEKVVRNALTAAARKFAKSAAAAAPYDEVTKDNKGRHIRDSIKVSWDRKAKEISVGVKKKDAFYASKVEYGTVHNAPKPFFRSTYAAEIGNMTMLIIDNMSKGMQKQLKKLKGLK